MSSDALVSVVISFWNPEPFLAEAVESVLAQTYDCWELLLVDDGSTDGSTALALHRSYSNSFSQRRSRSGEFIREYRRSLEIVGTYLPDYFPEPTAERLLERGRESVVRYALAVAARYIEARDLPAAIRLVREALRSSSSHRILRPTAGLAIWFLERQLQALKLRLGREAL
jgi:hypothetical protein